MLKKNKKIKLSWFQNGYIYKTMDTEYYTQYHIISAAYLCTEGLRVMHLDFLYGLCIINKVIVLMTTNLLIGKCSL